VHVPHVLLGVLQGKVGGERAGDHAGPFALEHGVRHSAQVKHLSVESDDEQLRFTIGC